MTGHDGGAPPGPAPATPSGDAVPDFAQKAQENAHRQSITEYAQHVLGMELAPWQKRYLEELAQSTADRMTLYPRRESFSAALARDRLLYIEGTARNAANAIESGDLDLCIDHLEAARRIAYLHRTITTLTEGQP